MPINRTQIATGGTLAALGVLAAAALGVAGGQPTPAKPTAAPAPEVRTETIRRTVHVRSKAKPVRTPAVAAPAPAPARVVRAAAAAPVASSSVSSDDHGDDHSGHGGGDDGHDD